MKNEKRLLLKSNRLLLLTEGAPHEEHYKNDMNITRICQNTHTIIPIDVSST